MFQQIAKDKDFKDAKFDTGYFDKNLANFNLEAINERTKEEKKIKYLTDLIDPIKKHNISVRY